MNESDDIVASGQSRQSAGSLAISFSSASSASSSSGGTNPVKAAVNECLNAWLNYLHILNSLCASGTRLAQAIATLEQWGPNQQQQAQSNPHTSQPHPNCSAQFISAWDDLARATAVATSTVKSHVVSVLQDFVVQPYNIYESDGDIQREHNHQIIMETTQTMVNIQHQFCVASYESFSTLMCCFICQAPVGFPHDNECAFRTRHASTSSDLRSQTPSPHFGQLSMNLPKTEHTRVPSPHQDIRGPSPIHNFLENIRGPLPNPGHLLGMKAPFYRCSRSPLNFPLFPLQRRWSEAAAGEVKDFLEKAGESIMDAENMRRWSMPWESKSDRNTVTWHQTRITSKMQIPIMNVAQSIVSKSNSDRSQSTTPDSFAQSSVTSQDGLAEAIQLLSFRPSRAYQPPPLMGAAGHGMGPHQPSMAPHQQMGPPQSMPGGPSQILPEDRLPDSTYVAHAAPAYEMWSSRDEDRLPSIKFARNRNNSKKTDDN